MPVSLSEAAVLAALLRVPGFPWRLGLVVGAMSASTLLCFLGNLAEL